MSVAAHCNFSEPIAQVMRCQIGCLPRKRAGGSRSADGLTWAAAAAGGRERRVSELGTYLQVIQPVRTFFDPFRPDWPGLPDAKGDGESDSCPIAVFSASGSCPLLPGGCRVGRVCDIVCWLASRVQEGTER